MIHELSNEKLVSLTFDLFKTERLGQVSILEHLREIDSRRLYLERGYPNLFEMCVQEFRCSSGGAQRRIHAMRLMREVPEVAPKIETGELNLSVLAHAQRFFRAEKREHREYTPAEKYELLSGFVGKSTREVERILSIANPSIAKREHLQVLSANEVKISLVVSMALQEKIQRLRELTSHANPELRLENLLETLVDRELRRFGIKPSSEDPTGGEPGVQPRPAKNSSKTDLGEKDKVAKRGRKHPQGLLSKHRRYISPQVRREVFGRDEGCSYVDPETKRRCGSKLFVQVDHILPLAMGGSSDKENLRLLCAAHNRSRPDLIRNRPWMIH
ncbi:MAG: HNH endonuclease [Bdellovibrionaceae bacterium]|nr:HNH endonuclease [Pseudobdellovibrionaceae bacterium]